MFPRFILATALLLSSTLAAEPDQGENSSLRGMREVWVSVQSVIFKSNLGGTRLGKLEDDDRDQLKEKLQALFNDEVAPRLRGAGLQVESSPPLVESALDILHEIQDEDDKIKITREMITQRARRANRKARDERDSHLRLFIEIQQDGLEHIGRIELSVIERVSLDRNPTARFHTITWQKAEEAVQLGINIDREALRSSVDALLKEFESGLASRP